MTQFSIRCTEATITPSGYKDIDVSIDTDVDEIISQLNVRDIINSVGISTLLEEIGQTEVEEYFDLVPNTE